MQLAVVLFVSNTYFCKLMPFSTWALFSWGYQCSLNFFNNLFIVIYFEAWHINVLMCILGFFTLLLCDFIQSSIWKSFTIPCMHFVCNTLGNCNSCVVADNGLQKLFMPAHQLCHPLPEFVYLEHQCMRGKSWSNQKTYTLNHHFDKQKTTLLICISRSKPSRWPLRLS